MAEVNVVTQQENKQEFADIFLFLVAIKRFVSWKRDKQRIEMSVIFLLSSSALVPV